MTALVGIVVVCHSRALARAAVALAQEMVHGRPVQIITAAGLDDTTFGTDAGQIVHAIAAADTGSGVVVLMDLGSAVLSAELALDLLDDDARRRVVLCPAPLVEGLIVAAAAAAGGATRQEVAAEAAQALAGKTEHLASTTVADHPPDEQAPTVGELSSVVTVVNPHGLHARPAARIVHEVRTRGSRVQLRNRTTGSAWAPASSLSAILALGALRGHDIEIRASGSDAPETLDHVLTLAAGDRDGTPAPDGGDLIASPAHRQTDHGVSTRQSLAASPGIGVGSARRWRVAPVDIPNARADNPAQEWCHFQKALAAVHDELRRVRACGARELGEADVAIFDTYLLLLDDPALHSEVRSRVDGGQAAAPAWSAAVTRIGEELAAIPNPYLQARAADVRAVGDQVLRELIGAANSTPAPAGVLVSADLTPADVARLDPAKVTAVLLAFGSPTAHSAILLRARGIPAVVAAGPAVLDIADGTLVAVDGTRGEFIVDPPADVREAFRVRVAEQAQRIDHAHPHATSPAATRDGVPVLVGANIAAVEDAQAAAALGADLAGLVRTEFLFLGRAQPPDVDEQEAVYRAIAEHLGGRRITLRTLDIGGDKPLSYLPMPPETNPFLGVRGIRLSLVRPRLLTEQLLAMVRVARDAPVSVMFPMISTLEEFRRARSILDDAIKQDGRGRPADLQVGIMVEVPAAALKASTFAPHVDFLSIGTNDLTQYTLAAERGNHAVAELGDPFDPGVLRLIDAVCKGAAGRAFVAVCGELAADERAAALLVGLGVRELSVAPPAIPTIKQAVRALNSGDVAEFGALALKAESAAAVRELLAESPRDRP
ncbi:MAG: phosphoenolpyruvate--protein phosphotransferase [Actinomycetota bacterium]|nr:phosphoenolpyruvate--protein phosphotransferase [Actinomycetota bacterium]